MAKKDDKRKKETKKNKPKKPKKYFHKVGALWSGWKEGLADLVQLPNNAVVLEYFITANGSLTIQFQRTKRRRTHARLEIPREAVQPLIDFLQEVDKNPSK
jgi:polynucleotide 5'-kinase involved in rRNA processing